jgi:hypothetical protein
LSIQNHNPNRINKQVYIQKGVTTHKK